MYGYKKEFKGTFEEAHTRISRELRKEGFGVLTEIDVKATLKDKLGEDFDNYMILGACNPSLAFKALKAEKEIGLMLPCNIIVFENRGKVFISAILASEAMSMIDNPELAQIANQAEKKLKKVVVEAVK